MNRGSSPTCDLSADERLRSIWNASRDEMPVLGMADLTLHTLSPAVFHRACCIAWLARVLFERSLSRSWQAQGSERQHTVCVPCRMEWCVDLPTAGTV